MFVGTARGRLSVLRMQRAARLTLTQKKVERALPTCTRG